MSRGEKSRRKSRSNGPKFLQLYHWIIQSNQFAAMTGSELKLFIDLAALHDGENNGNLSFESIRKRWKSRTTMQCARDGLIKKGWIVRTRKGGLNWGPDLYALTIWPIAECNGKHEATPETRASHEWAKTKKADQKLELVVPETGTVDVL